MIDTIDVDARYCWEPLCGMDALIYLFWNVDRFISVNPVDDALVADWVEYLCFDCRGMCVYVYAPPNFTVGQVEAAFWRIWDERPQKVLLSGITRLIAEIEEASS